MRKAAAQATESLSCRRMSRRRNASLCTTSDGGGGVTDMWARGCEALDLAQAHAQRAIEIGRRRQSCRAGTMETAELERARRLLCDLQDHIRASLIAARRRQSRSFARVAGVTAADTIYRIDRLSEEAIRGWFAEHWPKSMPVELVMEGLADDEWMTFPLGAPPDKT